MSIEEDADLILHALENFPRDMVGHATMNGQQIQEATDLEPIQINDAIAILEGSGLIELNNWVGTAPFFSERQC